MNIILIPEKEVLEKWAQELQELVNFFYILGEHDFEEGTPINMCPLTNEAAIGYWSSGYMAARNTKNMQEENKNV